LLVCQAQNHGGLDNVGEGVLPEVVGGGPPAVRGGPEAGVVVGTVDLLEVGEGGGPFLRQVQGELPYRYLLAVDVGDPRPWESAAARLGARSPYCRLLPVAPPR